MYLVVYCLTILCAILQVSSIEPPKPFEDKISVECIQEVKVDISILKNMLDEKYIIISTDPLVYSFFECVFNKNKFIKDGEFVKDTIVNYIAKNPLPFFKPDAQNPDKVAEDAYNLCKNVKGDVIGERAANLMNCVTAELTKKSN
ncbi:hypothetical protein RI129_009376 [Pyrocoelia pectoralis]|uniref:Uncharacterized protein n=1 Tax=Pyrocoelia pectoralis TaxID=417401 RepID=A0AAN7VBI6_9COLE